MLTPAGRGLAHVVTVVHYRNWKGPLYFNLIRPFHHLVLGGMTTYAASNRRS